MKKFVCLSLTAALVLSLCACSKSGDNLVGDETESSSSFVEVSDPFNDDNSSETESDDTPSGVGDGYDYLRAENPGLFTEDYIDSLKYANSGLSFDNWQYKADGKKCSGDSSVTYSGGEMEIIFSETIYTQAREHSTGYMVFIGGTPQIIALNGSEPSTMALDVGKDGETKECKINFTPRLTKENIDNKDDLKMTLIGIKNPLYLTTGSAEKQLDYEHYLSVPSRKTFKLEGDCEITELVSNKSFEHFPETDRAVRDYLKEILSQLEDKDIVFFDLYSAQRADKPFLKDGKTDIALLLYGGKQKNAVYKVYFYVNHKPVKIDGCDYITAELKEGFVSKYTVTLDNVKERDFVYAIAVSETNEGITRVEWAMKTDTRRLFTSN